MKDTFEDVLGICCFALMILVVFSACFYIIKGSYDKATFEAVIFFGLAGVINNILISSKLRRIDEHILEGKVDEES